MTTKAKKPTPQSPSKASSPRTAVVPVGIVEIAERLDVASDTVQKWRVRLADTDTPFPEPRGVVGGTTPWWHWGDVQRWAKKAGRA